jgi:hypothetical protein
VGRVGLEVVSVPGVVLEVVPEQWLRVDMGGLGVPLDVVVVDPEAGLGLVGGLRE